MSLCRLRFHGELTEILTTSSNQGCVDYPLTRRASIKDIIESLGPPHTEVGQILVQDTEVGFDYIPDNATRIQVHPLHPPVDPRMPTSLRPRALSEIRFVVDVNVGKVAKLLRMLGLDTAYEWSWRDSEIARVAEQEGRIVLSKDQGLLKRSRIDWGRLIRGHTPQEQVQEVLHFFDLRGPFALFSRCLVCNVPLRPVSKQAIVHRLKPKTKRYFHRFHICPECQRIYWQGSHHDRMQEWLDRILPSQPRVQAPDR